MAHRNRWFTELKNGWIFPWRTVSHNQMVDSNTCTMFLVNIPLWDRSMNRSTGQVFFVVKGILASIWVGMTRWECDKRRQVQFFFFRFKHTKTTNLAGRVSSWYYHSRKCFEMFTNVWLKDFTAEVQRVRGDQARLSVRDEAPRGSRQFLFWILCWIDENGDTQQVPGKYVIVELLNQRKREDLSTEHHLISRHRTTKVGIWIWQAKVAVFISNT